MSEPVPTLYDWAGGGAAFERLTEVFYAKVRQDDLLEPVFRGMDADHPKHVAAWLAEVFGGPPKYTDEHGGYPHMLAKHRGLAITPEQRLRFVTLLSRAADDVELPPDPEFRAAVMAYAEWGSRLAVHNSQPGAEVAPHAPVPRWDWGAAPPYQP